MLGAQHHGRGRSAARTSAAFSLSLRFARLRSTTPATGCVI